MDLRIQKTYRSLLVAFTKLLETHRYEDVTIAMLCDEAMIRRTTFYKHFADKSEFFSFFVDSLRIEITKYGEEQSAGSRSAESDGGVNAEEGLAILRALVDFMLDHERMIDKDVYKRQTKYDLVAMPVCDENRHILGIVTVDDALDVIAEEHAEDLQIAGVSVGESNAGESTHAFTWFSQRQYWVVVWAIAACAIAAIVVTPLERLDLNVMGIATAHQMITSQGLTALMPISIMPVVLLASMRMVSFVKHLSLIPI